MSSFDLFSGLAALGGKDYNWFDNLDDAGKKAAAPFVMARWMTGTSDLAQIIRINEVVNPYLFTGAIDKAGLFKLLPAAATGRTKRYYWLKGPGPKAKSAVLDIIKRYYDCSTREAQSYKISPEDIIEMAEELGIENDELKKLQKDLGVEAHKVEKPKAKRKK